MCYRFHQDNASRVSQIKKHVKSRCPRYECLGVDLWHNGGGKKQQKRKNNDIIRKSLGYVWFSENLRENARERKYKGKVEGKKK